MATVAETMETYVTPYASHFRRLGARVDGMANGIESSRACREAFDRCFEASWTRNPGNLAAALRAYREVRSLIDLGRYDLVHFHTPIAAFVGRCAVRFGSGTRRPRVVYTAHGFHFHPAGRLLANATYLALEKLAASWTDFLVVINEWDFSMARRWRFSPRKGIQRLPGAGFDGERFRAAAVSEHEVAQVRRTLGLQDREPLFLVVARYAGEKRPDDVLRALARCRSRHAHVAFAGREGPDPSLWRLSSKLGIDTRVHFLGYRRDIPALMKASIATILPSSREGLPLSVMESLSIGVPVIGSDIRGIRDLLGQGGGLLIPLGDVPRMAAAMDWVVENPRLATELGRRGKARVHGYERESILRLHERLYEQAVGARIRPASAAAPKVAAVQLRESTVSARRDYPNPAGAS